MERSVGVGEGNAGSIEVNMSVASSDYLCYISSLFFFLLFVFVPRHPMPLCVNLFPHHPSSLPGSQVRQKDMCNTIHLYLGELLKECLQLFQSLNYLHIIYCTPTYRLTLEYRTLKLISLKYRLISYVLSYIAVCVFLNSGLKLTMGELNR